MMAYSLHKIARALSIHYGNVWEVFEESGVLRVMSYVLMCHA